MSIQLVLFSEQFNLLYQKVDIMLPRKL